MLSWQMTNRATVAEPLTSARLINWIWLSIAARRGCVARRPSAARSDHTSMYVAFVQHQQLCKSQHCKFSGHVGSHAFADARGPMLPESSRGDCGSADMQKTHMWSSAAHTNCLLAKSCNALQDCRGVDMSQCEGSRFAANERAWWFGMVCRRRSDNPSASAIGPYVLHVLTVTHNTSRPKSSFSGSCDRTNTQPHPHQSLSLFRSITSRAYATVLPTVVDGDAMLLRANYGVPPPSPWMIGDVLLESE
jgi:hypothetical protein